MIRPTIVIGLVCILSNLDYGSPTTITPTTKPDAVSEETAVPILESHFWPTGFKMKIRFQFLDDVIGGWKMTLKFSEATPGLQIWRAVVVSVSSDKKEYTLQNMPWNRNFKKCDEFQADFMARKDHGSQPPTAVVEFHRKNADNINQDPNACSTTMPPTDPPTTLPPSTSAPRTTSIPTTTKQPTVLLTTTEQPTPSTVPTTLPSSPTTQWPLMGGLTTSASILEEWETGFKMSFRFLVKNEIMNGWLIKLKFSKPALQLRIWRAKLISQSSDNTEYFATNMPFNANLLKCSVLEMTFMAQKEKYNESAPSVDVTLYHNNSSPEPTDNTICTTTMPPSTANPVTQTTVPPVTNKPMTQKPETSSPVTEKPTTQQPESTPVPDKPTTVKPGTFDQLFLFYSRLISLCL